MLDLITLQLVPGVVAILTTMFTPVPTPRSRAHLDVSVVHGTLDRTFVRRFLKRRLIHFARCADHDVQIGPDAVGHATFVIAADGTVAHADVVGPTGPSARCIAGVIESIAFPKPTGGDVAVSASIPMVQEFR